MLLLKTSLGWLCFSAVRANSHCESHVVEDTEDTFNGFLQVNMETHAEIVHATSHGDVPKMWPLLEIKIDPKRQVSYQPETVTPLLHFFSQFSKAVVMVLYFFLLMSVIVWLLRGLPTKAPQDESVKDGCPTTWLLFLCSTYGFIFFYHGSVCTKSSADGCGSFRVSRRHECDRAVELRGEISHWSGHSWHL